MRSLVFQILKGVDDLIFDENIDLGWLTTQSPRLATRQDILLEAPVCATTVEEFSVKNFGLSSVLWRCASSRALLCVMLDTSRGAVVPVVRKTVLVAFDEFRDGDTVEVRAAIFGFPVVLPPVSGTEFFFPSPVTQSLTRSLLSIYE